MFFSSFFLALAVILVSGDEPLSNFSTVPLEDHFCETILKSNHQYKSRFIKMFTFTVV